MSDQKFAWFFNVSSSLGFGAMLTVFFFALMLYNVATPLMETFLLPGIFVGKAVYGGWHGGEPYLLMLITNCIVYGLFVLGVRWLAFRKANK